MPRLNPCPILLLAILASCGSPPPPDPKPVPTVFDDIVSKKQTLPAAVEKAQQEHMQALREQDAAANGEPAGNPPR
jgi:outer membrane murein-binding lipoprotein Lpp